MKAGDRVKTRSHGEGVAIEMDGDWKYFESRQWWLVKLDSQPSHEPPYRFMQRDLEIV